MKQVKRVSKKNFETEVEDKVTEGYKVSSKTDRQAVLVKKHLGKPMIHIILFILTVWFTLGLVNVAYALYSYLVGVDEIQIKVSK